ncbi:MAG: PTS system nitrogen regulatory IIA component [bacterium]|jgi:PTS system nitrogen regulatory IIA component
MLLGNYTKESLISLDVSGRNKHEVLVSLVKTLNETIQVPDLEKLISLLSEREQISTTGIGYGVAIPHCRTPDVKTLHIVIGRSIVPIDYSASDGRPVKLFFLIVGPEHSTGEHLKALAKIARLTKNPKIRNQLMDIESVPEFLEYIHETEKNY